MIFRRKTFYNISLLAALSVSFAGCTGNQSKKASKQSIHAYETELALIVKEAEELQAKENLAPFISLYNRSLSVMDLIPDTSAIKAKSLEFFADILKKNGGYREAIKIIWRLLESNRRNHFKNTDIADVSSLVYLANLYKQIGKQDSGLIVLRLAVARSIKYIDSIKIASTLNNIGIFYYESGKPDSAMFYFKIVDSSVRAHLSANPED